MGVLRDLILIRARNLILLSLADNKVLRDLILIRARNLTSHYKLIKLSFKRPDFDKG